MQLVDWKLGAKITKRFQEDLARDSKSWPKSPKMIELVKKLKDANIACFETPEEEKLRDQTGDQLKLIVTDVMKGKNVSYPFLISDLRWFDFIWSSNWREAFTSLELRTKRIIYCVSRPV